MKIIVFSNHFKETSYKTILSCGFERHATSKLLLHESGLELSVQLMYFIARIHRILLLSEGHDIE